MPAIPTHLTPNFHETGRTFSRSAVSVGMRWFVPGYNDTEIIAIPVHVMSLTPTAFRVNGRTELLRLAHGFNTAEEAIAAGRAWAQAEHEKALKAAEFYGAFLKGA
jgi:hypothetical protein